MITQQLVTNPGFEVQNSPDGSTPAGWVVNPSLIVMTKTTPFSGGWCAKLCGRGINATTDYLYQEIDIPEFAIASLSFALSIVNDIVSPDSTSAPSCTLALGVQDQIGTDLETLATWDVTSRLTGIGWFQAGYYDLTKYAGQTIRLRFTSTQANGAQSASFYIDEVRINAVLNLPVSTFPPLISDKSLDAQGHIQQYGNRVYCSCLIRREADDQFFFPTFGSAGGLTGYASDGSYYVNGVVQVNHAKAQWWTESVDGGDQVTRGPLQSFPTTALVTVTDLSISITDQTDFFSMWMIFKKKPNNAYSDSFNLGPDIILVPESVEYSSGVLSVTFQPGEGATFTSTVVLHIDFAQDFIYIDAVA